MDLGTKVPWPRIKGKAHGQPVAPPASVEGSRILYLESDMPMVKLREYRYWWATYIGRQPAFGQSEYTVKQHDCVLPCHMDRETTYQALERGSCHDLIIGLPIYFYFSSFDDKVALTIMLCYLPLTHSSSPYANPLSLTPFLLSLTYPMTRLLSAIGRYTSFTLYPWPLLHTLAHCNTYP